MRGCEDACRSGTMRCDAMRCDVMRCDVVGERVRATWKVNQVKTKNSKEQTVSLFRRSSTGRQVNVEPCGYEFETINTQMRDGDFFWDFFFFYFSRGSRGPCDDRHLRLYVCSTLLGTHLLLTSRAIKLCSFRLSQTTTLVVLRYPKDRCI